MKTYYEEVKAWLDGPDDGRIPSEAIIGLINEHEWALNALKRLSSCEAFGPPGAIDKMRDEEVLLRMDYAAKIFNSLGPQNKPPNPKIERLNTL